MSRRAVWTLAALSVLLTARLDQCRARNEITVDPPEDLRVSDLGHLGQLLINWSPPASVKNLTDCSARFQLQYFYHTEDRWKTVRTTRHSYRVQFDLEKEVCVRVQTMLKGSCTGGASELPSRYAEVRLQPPVIGPPGSRIEGLSCVFYQKEYMHCTWKPGQAETHVEYHLYFWHEGMDQASECPEYLRSHGHRTGCRLPGEALLEFTDFNICVNGSATAPPIQPAYFTLQLQNQVKPAAIDTFSLETLPDGQVLLEWMPPRGKIPEDCLEFEVESRPGAKDGLMTRNSTRSLSLTVPGPEYCEANCFQVRSRVHQYCSDKSFWSDWSHARCLPEGLGCLQARTEAVVLSGIAGAIIILFSLSMCWLIYGKLLKTQGRKKVILL